MLLNVKELQLRDRKTIKCQKCVIFEFRNANETDVSSISNYSNLAKNDSNQNIFLLSNEKQFFSFFQSEDFIDKLRYTQLMNTTD